MKKLWAFSPKAPVCLRVYAPAFASLSLILSAVHGASHTALAATGAASETVASTSLCADMYVLALAPERVVAMSWQSRAPLARTPKTHIDLPQIWDDPEIIAKTDASLIVFGAGEGRISSKSLDSDTQTYVTLAWSEDFDGVKENISKLGAALGRVSEAQTLIQNFTARLDAIQTQPVATKPKILYLSRSGATAGPGTYVDAVIQAAGGTNIVTQPGWHTPDPEVLISYRPDLIMTSFFKEGYESIQSTAVRHASVRAYIARYPVIDIPGHLWPCAGPELVSVAERLADRITTFDGTITP